MLSSMFLWQAGNFATLDRKHGSPNNAIDIFAGEVHRTIAQNNLDAASMPAP